MQADRRPGSDGKEQARIEGGKGRERDRGEGGSEMLGRKRASVEEGWVDKGTERGMDSARERWEGGSERRRD